METLGRGIGKKNRGLEGAEGKEMERLGVNERKGGGKNRWATTRMPFLVVVSQSFRFICCVYLESEEITGETSA